MLQLTTLDVACIIQVFLNIIFHLDASLMISSHALKKDEK